MTDYHSQLQKQNRSTKPKILTPSIYTCAQTLRKQAQPVDRIYTSAMPAPFIVGNDCPHAQCVPYYMCTISS